MTDRPHTHKLPTNTEEGRLTKIDHRLTQMESIVGHRQPITGEIMERYVFNTFNNLSRMLHARLVICYNMNSISNKINVSYGLRVAPIAPAITSGFREIYVGFYILISFLYLTYL